MTSDDGGDPSDHDIAEDVPPGSGKVLQTIKHRIPGLGRKVKETGKPISHRQSMQRFIVRFVVGLLSVTFLTVIVRWAVDPTVATDSFSAAILAPALALGGPVLGFYFDRRGSDE